MSMITKNRHGAFIAKEDILIPISLNELKLNIFVLRHLHQQIYPTNPLCKRVWKLIEKLEEYEND